MGTALAMSLARKGEQVTLWGSEFDARVLPELIEKRSHPALPATLPDSVQVAGPDELEQAAKGASIGVMAAHSGGARSLAGLVGSAVDDIRIVVSLAKGLEPESRKRMTEVYSEELGKPVVAVGGPALAAEVAEGLPCTAVLACEHRDALRETTEAFRSETYRIHDTTDCTGLEYCSTAKNVGAIASGVLEGIGSRREQGYKNARSALFTQAVHEMASFVQGLGGKRETAFGLAGMGDLLVTSLGGRNRQYGEMVGSGADPKHAETDMKERGMTVEGTESARDVHDLAKEAGLDLPIHEAVYRVVHEGASPGEVLEALR